MVGGSAGTTNSNSAESIHHQQGQGTGGCSTPVQPRTASIRARPTSSRITAAELEELFQRQQGCSNGNCRLCCWVETRLSLKREKTNKMQQSDVYYQLLSQHVSGIIMPRLQENKDRVLLHTVYCAVTSGKK